MSESHVGTVVTADDRARFSLFKDFDLRGWWFTDPFDGMCQPGIRWIVDVAHLCNCVLSLQQSIAEARRRVQRFGTRSLIKIIDLKTNRAGAGASDTVEDTHDFAVRN